MFGATDFVCAADGEAVKAVLDMTRGGVDQSFEAVGLKVTAEQAFGMLQARRHGQHHRHDPGRPDHRDSRAPPSWARRSCKAR